MSVLEKEGKRGASIAENDASLFFQPFGVSIVQVIMILGLHGQVDALLFALDT